MLDLETFEKSIKLITPWTHPLPSCAVSILQGPFVSKTNVVEVYSIIVICSSLYTDTPKVR